MCSCEFCEISKNNFFTEHFWTTASAGSIICPYFDTIILPTLKKVEIVQTEESDVFLQKSWTAQKH